MALYEKTASELSELLGKKEISAVELAKDVFARTKAVEDKVQGYVTVAEESARLTRSAPPAIRCPRWPVSRSQSRTTSAPRAR